MKATDKNLSVIASLQSIVNHPSGSNFVPFSLAGMVRDAAATIGLCLCSGIKNYERNEVLLYIA